MMHESFEEYINSYIFMVYTPWIVGKYMFMITISLFCIYCIKIFHIQNISFQILHISFYIYNIQKCYVKLWVIVFVFIYCIYINKIIEHITLCCCVFSEKLYIIVYLQKKHICKRIINNWIFYFYCDYIQSLFFSI